ncbi:hypothetical protein TYRP_002707 [Tyrophagus putrescentiae]|nr:hypothetical protein TYRP_002707 [Tyrophagus putrescentiae]
MKSLNRSLKSTVNLGNSIIGVSILAMPLCYRQCGILLSVLVLGLSALLNQFSCYLLLKSAIINRRKNYELLAYDVFGAGGKTLVEICMLFYLLGTCIAFFVIVGDIAPSLVAASLGVDNGPHLRTLIVTGLGMFVIFPLGLMRNVESLTSFSMVSLVGRLPLPRAANDLTCLRQALRPAAAAAQPPPPLNVWTEVNLWDSTFVISYLPIFSMALSCQGQIFEIFQQDLYQADSFRSLKFMVKSTKRAILLTSVAYTLIGLFGYLAFFDVPGITGNILQSLPGGLLTQLTLLLFLLTLLTSFPLCLFPCRTSLHSLLFRTGHGYSDVLSTAHSAHAMSDAHFRLLTMLLIVTTMSVSIIFPHVELVLALVGSTAGAVICFLIPALIFIRLSDKNTVEYLLSYLLVFFGAVILVFCTFSALHSISVARDVEMEEKINEIKQKSTVAFVPPPPPPLKTITERSPVAGKEKEKEKEKELLLEKKKNSPPVVVTADYKGHIKNITKLRESVKLDLKKLKKQDELLQRLEKQQLEHSKLLKEQREIINELKSHDKIFHEDDKKKEAKKKEGNLTVEKQHKLDSGKLASSPPAAAAVAAVKPEMPVKRSLISNGNASSEALAAAAAAPPLPPNPSPVIASYAQSKAVIASNISNQKVEPVINKEVAQLKAEAKPPLNTIVQSPGPSNSAILNKTVFRTLLR